MMASIDMLIRGLYGTQPSYSFSGLIFSAVENGVGLVSSDDKAPSLATGGTHLRSHFAALLRHQVAWLNFDSA